MEIFKHILNLSVVDIVDGILVAFLMYYLYKLVKGTVAINIFIGIIVVYIAWKLTDLLQMELLNSIFGGFIKVGIIALIVLFQPEIRKFLLMVGSTNFKRKSVFLTPFNFSKANGDSETNVDAILSACTAMAASKTGALIVFERHNNLDFIASTGDEMSISVTQPIIVESIFFKNSPLHDGAVIVHNNIIKAARVILPVHNEKSIPKRFGLRHRAAIGVTEKTDAIALVVSEETGHISYFRDGAFVAYTDLEQLRSTIKKDLV